VQTELSPGALAIYVHWPYCQAKCPYCDFNSYARTTISEADFLRGILREIETHRGFLNGRTITSVFFGGGTPSLMSPATVGAILDGIAAAWRMDEGAEITLEANPSSVEAGRFAGYRAAGVNRVSIGVQSLRDDALKFLGRLHSAEEAREALKIADRLFDRYSFDLIYALPEQRPQDWEKQLTEALELANGHLSVYQLTIEPETAFFDLERRGKLRIPLPDTAAELYALTQDICEAAALPAYEISNHARPGHESRHNLTYWRYGEYAGLGPGAHGRVHRGGSKQATACLRQPIEWLTAVDRDGIGWSCEDALPMQEQAEEMLLMGLRLREGLDLDRLTRETGHGVEAGAVTQLAKEGYLVGPESNRVLRPTRQGSLVLNAIVAELSKALRPVPLSTGPAMSRTTTEPDRRPHSTEARPA
jgi:oxygen-independent coproporphyrinogen-3 oxidase